MSELSLWTMVAETNKAFVSDFDNKRFKGTAVDATYQKQRATELWGPYGKPRWGLKDMKWDHVCGADGVPLEVTLEATFFYPDTTVDGEVVIGGEFEISANHAWNRGHDHRKILQTELLKKALTYLGFSADVYLGKFDDDAYAKATKKMDDHGVPQDEKVEQIVEAMSKAPDDKTLNRYMLKAQSYGLSSYYIHKVQCAMEARKMELQAGALFSGDE